MKTMKLASIIALGFVLLCTWANLFAHGPGNSNGSLMVTRHFTGTWNQIDQESQGLSLEVIDQLDGARRAAVYWYTYGMDRQPTWFLGIGDLVDNRIDFTLYESSDVGFMQDNLPGDESVQPIGSMSIVFDSCDSGVVNFETIDEYVGNGSFNIGRSTRVMNTRCSGGISDDMPADARLGEQRIQLMPAREGVTGSGHARYEDFPGHMEFEVEMEGLPDGDYHVHVGSVNRGEFSVVGGRGVIRYASPGETGRTMMTFDPRGMSIEIHDDAGIVLSSFDDMFERYDHHHGDGDHMYDCEMGHGMGGGMGGGGMGGGMADCVYDGEFVEIEIDLINTGELREAKGEAEWDMNSNRVRFSVEIEDVPVGLYTLVVGGAEVGIINAFEMHDGEVYGRITFRDPEVQGREHLDFEPRGQMIEVRQGAKVILQGEFPSE